FKAIPKESGYEAKCGANSRPVFFIGVDSNQNYLGDTDNNPDTLNYGLTSMVKRVDNAVYAVISDVVKGTAWKSGQRTFGLSNGGISFALDKYNQKLISAATRVQLTKVQNDIISGKIKVPQE
ncbi:MAG TPA: BMP family ABC transporter substrate-binding protein, partial [Deinococcales bacterium]|nr:BMP family ABC transporter substrate-binding protein [Deinococcales bacterium]